MSRVPELIRRRRRLPQRWCPACAWCRSAISATATSISIWRSPRARTRQSFLARNHEIMDAVGEVVRALDGSFSAEHGVGRLKPYMMPLWRGGAELATMRRIKQALDPRGLMNPGKVLPAETDPAP